MSFGQIKWLRFAMTVFVMLTLAVLPGLSQIAMASHHAMGGAAVASVSSGEDHQMVDSSSCEQKSGTQSGEQQMNCCDMNCSGFAVVATKAVLPLNNYVEDYFETDAEQLTSRIVFGLMRPPRA